jgi:hypothetical protein
MDFANGSRMADRCADDIYRRAIARPVFHLTRVMYKAILGLHYKRREQKKSGQLAIF